MALTNNDKKYTAADFEQYHNGTMPQAEMYALEKAALEDPFLSDALDGYIFTSTAQQDIEELKGKIPPKKDKKPATIVSFKSMWLRIAAVLILVCGIGYISYVSLNKRSENTFAKLDEVPKVTPATQPVINDAEKLITQQTQTSSETKIVPPEKNNVIAQSDNSVTFDNTTMNAPQIQQSEKDAIAETPSPSTFTEKKTGDSKNKYFLKGQVTNVKGEPLSFASVQNDDKKTSVSADVNGRFSMPVEDSITSTSIAALGYATTKKILKADDEQTIVLKQNDQSLEEVVISGYGQTKRKSVTGSVSRVESKNVNDALSGKVAEVNVATNSQPVIGASQYDKYITDSLKAPAGADQQPYEGSVELSFEVNKNGEPKKIKVEKSICAACDAEAIRLLKAGPKWTYVKGKRTTTTIKF